MCALLVIPAILKDPDSKLDYGVDWRLQDGETITSSAWAIDVAPDDSLSISVSPAPFIDGANTTVWLEGGTLAQRYRVRNRITTSMERRDDQSFWIEVVNT